MWTESDIFRFYDASECGKDGYPHAWHDLGEGIGVKDLVRQNAGNRCMRCGHPYQPGGGEWTPCDSQCVHLGPLRNVTGSAEAQWRILTVHHLLHGHEAKRNLCWWNLVALCQRCHLTIQGKVVMQQIWPWEHSEWFKPYAAGWYAWTYLGQNLTPQQVTDRMPALLSLELTTGVYA